MLRSNAFMFALVNMAAFQDNFVQIKSIYQEVVEMLEDVSSFGNPCTTLLLVN